MRKPFILFGSKLSLLLVLLSLLLVPACFQSKSKPTTPNNPTNPVDQDYMNIGVNGTVFSSSLSTQNTDPDDAPTLGEVGQVDITQANPSTWYTVELLGTNYTDPVVIMQPLTYNEVDPAFLRVRNVTSTSFEFQVQEWDYLANDPDHAGHVTERVGYLVVERGSHVLLGGLKLEAGTIEVGTKFKAVRFEHIYDNKPIVLSQVSSDLDPTAVISRQRDIKAKGNEDSGGFSIQLQEEETNDNEHAAELVSYIAIEQNEGQTNNSNYIAGLTPQEVDHNWYTLNLGNLSPAQVNNQNTDGPVRVFGEPILLANMQTKHGGNPATIRYRNLTPTSVEIFIQDEQSMDAEQKHPKKEIVGFLAFDTGFIFADPIETENKLEIVSKHILSDKAELGQVKLSQATSDWHSITTLQSYTDPVVIAQPLSFAGGQPATIRVKEVTSGNFLLRIEEWSYLDNNHPEETISYLVVEKGEHSLGSLAIEANTVLATKNFEKITLATDTSTNPVILTQTQTVNDPVAVVTRQKLANNGDLKIKLQGEELNDKEHGGETVAYVVLSQGEGSTNHVDSYSNYYIANTADEVDHQWYDLIFPANLITVPNVDPAPTPLPTPYFFANMQSTDGNNTASLRYRELSTSGASIFVEEEQSKDRERWHRTEIVGFAAFLGFKTSSTNEWQEATLGNGTGSNTYDPNTNTFTINLENPGPDPTSYLLHQPLQGQDPLHLEACFGPELPDNAEVGLILFQGIDNGVLQTPWVKVVRTEIGARVTAEDTDGSTFIAFGSLNDPQCFRISKDGNTAYVYESVEAPTTQSLSTTSLGEPDSLITSLNLDFDPDTQPLGALDTTSNDVASPPITVSANPITVGDAPAGSVIANVSVSTDFGDVPLTVDFDASASEGSNLTYDWDFGDGSVATGVTVSHTYTTESDYTAVLTVTDDSGTSWQAQIIIVAVEPPPDPNTEELVAEVNLGINIPFGFAPLEINPDAFGSEGTDLTYDWILEMALLLLVMKQPMLTMSMKHLVCIL